MESDHNILVLYLSLKWNQQIRVERKEVYNLRNAECQQIFQTNTSNHPKLFQVLENCDIVKGGAKWIKEINHEISKSFKKIRISHGKVKVDKSLNDLFIKREKLKIRESKSFLNKEELDMINSELKDVDREIAEIHSEENFNTIKEHVKHLVDDTENLNCIKMWQLKKKICAKKPEPPVAKKNEKGELVTDTLKLKELYETTYKKRLEHRMMKPELAALYNQKMSSFNLRIEVTRNMKSKSWSVNELEKVLKSLKKNKSADSQGLIYELFRPEIIGTDLFSSLLLFCNTVKSQLLVPKFVTFTDITSIYKSRGESS